MIKKTITCKDYNGEVRTETFYFNLSKAEILEMELLTEGGMEQLINKIIETKDTPSLIKIFKTLICKSYGEKSPDGRRFIKSEELTNEFTQTEFYSTLFMELATDSEAASEFVSGIIPDDINLDDPQIKAQIAEKLNA